MLFVLPGGLYLGASPLRLRYLPFTVYVPEEVAREVTTTADRLNLRRGHLYGVAFSIGYNRMMSALPGASAVPVVSAKSEETL
jgi:hypothetical protein